LCRRRWRVCGARDGQQGKVKRIRPNPPSPHPTKKKQKSPTDLHTHTYNTHTHNTSLSHQLQPFQPIIPPSPPNTHTDTPPRFSISHLLRHHGHPPRPHRGQGHQHGHDPRPLHAHPRRRSLHVPLLRTPPEAPGRHWWLLPCVFDEQ
jgi:hypothetical protein